MTYAATDDEGGTRYDRGSYLLGGGEKVTAMRTRAGAIKVIAPFARLVDPADRERAADWLREWFPDHTHDERYRIIWGTT